MTSDWQNVGLGWLIQFLGWALRLGQAMEGECWSLVYCAFDLQKSATNLRKLCNRPTAGRIHNCIHPLQLCFRSFRRLLKFCIRLIRACASDILRMRILPTNILHPIFTEECRKAVQPTYNRSDTALLVFNEVCIRPCSTSDQQPGGGGRTFTPLTDSREAPPEISDYPNAKQKNNLKQFRLRHVFWLLHQDFFVSE